MQLENRRYSASQIFEILQNLVPTPSALVIIPYLLALVIQLECLSWTHTWTHRFSKSFRKSAEKVSRETTTHQADTLQAKGWEASAVHLTKFCEVCQDPSSTLKSGEGVKGTQKDL